MVLQSKLKTVLLAGSASLMACSLILFPAESVEASKQGLDMWWRIVFPSLLPFFIISEMLIGFGVVKFIGVLLEPVMRPFFKVPGVGGFVWAMGMASGFPAGAKLTARLRQEGQLSKTEAERLVTFTNCSNPLFIFGAVSVGFFLNEKLGIILALAHYLGNFTVGLIMRFYGKDAGPVYRERRFSLKAAFQELHKTRINDNRPLGKIMGDAVTSSIHTLLMIGGFIILFSVLNKLLYQLNITSILSEAAKIIMIFFHLPETLSFPLISGLFEITLGSRLASLTEEASLMHQAIITSVILAFSGFSVQAQVASILAQTDIRFKPFFISRILHSFFAGLYAFLLWKPLSHIVQSGEKPAFITAVSEGGEPAWPLSMFSFINEIGPLFTIAALMVYIVLLSKEKSFTNNKKST